MSSDAPPPYPAGADFDTKQVPQAGQPMPAQAVYPAQAAYPAQAYPAQAYPAQGYPAQQTGHPVQGYPQQQTVVMTSNVQTPYRSAYAFSYYQYIPILHIAPAIIGLVFNIIGFGLGSMMAAFFIFCGGHTYLTTQSRALVCFFCFGAGLLQMCLALFSFLGWIWAIFWGVLFVTSSSQYYGHPIDPNRPQTTTTTIITAA